MMKEGFWGKQAIMSEGRYVYLPVTCWFPLTTSYSSLCKKNVDFKNQKLQLKGTKPTTKQDLHIFKDFIFMHIVRGCLVFVCGLAALFEL